MECCSGRMRVLSGLCVQVEWSREFGGVGVC